MQTMHVICHGCGFAFKRSGLAHHLHQSKNPRCQMPNLRQQSDHDPGAQDTPDNLPVAGPPATVIRCSTGCTHIPTGAENRSGGDRAERTPTTERVRGIPLPNQIRAETPGMHQTKPHPRSSLCASKRRRCWDARSVQDEDRGQGRLRIDRNSYLEVQDGPGSQRSGRTDRQRRK